MAVQNRNDMYSLGAVDLNSQPSVNIYAQHLQRKQAREEALDNYEMNRINRMNEQGVRDNDRSGLDARVIDLKTFYQANKDKIRKGGTPEAYNYEKMFRDTLAGISKSKQATAEDEVFGKLRLERKKDGRNTPEEWFDIYTKHQQTPVWDENFQPLPLAEFMELNVPVYDAAKSLKGYSDIKRTPGLPRYEQDPSDKFARLEYIDESFDKGAREAIRVRAKNEFDKDGSFANQVKSDFSNTVQRQNLEKTFIDAYGAAPQDMSDYAVAKKLSELQLTVTGKPKRVYNREQIMKEQQKNALNRLYVYAGIQQGKEDKNELLAIREFKSYINQAQKGGGEFTPRQEIVNNLSVQGILGKEYPTKFTLSDDGETVSYSISGKTKQLPVEAFFNDITNALPTKDKGSAAQKVIEGAKKTPTMVTVVLKDGTRGQIPSGQLNKFLKENPGSKKQ